MEHEKIRPETQALDTYIQAAVERLLSSDARHAPGDGLLFLGNWHDAMPRLIFQDPVLQPVDTRVWGVIKIAATGSGPTAFPTYKQIARTANVGSEATVARSMAILRAARWLSLCHRVRDAQGRFRGNIYALHDEPLPLADALFLDQTYIAFLEQARAHAHPQVRKVAAAVLGTIEEDLQKGESGIEAGHPMARRQAALRSLQGEATRFFGFSSHQLRKLKSVPEPTSPQKLKCGSLQKLKCDGSSSCSCLNKKTTTTTTTESGKADARAREDANQADKLVLPAALTPNEQQLARLCLRSVPEPLRQEVLDELSGRLGSAKRKDQPIDNPVGYLAQLCKAARQGTFTLTSLGLKVREQRAHAVRLERQEALSQERALSELQDLLASRGKSSPKLRRGDSAAGDGSAITPPTDLSPDGSAITPPHDPSPDGSAITPPHDPSADGSAITPPHDPSADGSAITPPHDISADGSAITPPHDTSADGSAITPPHDTSADGSAITPPHDTSADGSAITPPHDPSADGSAITSRQTASTGGRSIPSRAEPADGSAINPATGPPSGPPKSRG